MKTKNAILAFSIILVMAISVFPAKADFVSAQITPSTGIAGTASFLGGTISPDSITVQGQAEPNDIVKISVDDGSVRLSCDPCTAKASSTGAYTVSFNVPFVPGGAHTVKATNMNVTSLNPVTNTFTVVPVVELERAGQGSPFLTGNVGRTVTIEGSGFAASSSLTISQDGSSQPCLPTPSCGPTQPDGTFKVQFSVPDSVSGNHIVAATDASGASSSNRFTVVRGIQVSLTGSSPSSPHGAASCAQSQTCVVVGSAVTLKVNGFPGGQDFTVFFGGAGAVSSTDRLVCKDVHTGASGSANCSEIIPPTAQFGTSPSSTFYYKANDSIACGNCPSASVSLFPLLTLTPNHAAYNQQVNGLGTGFPDDATPTVAISAPCNGVAIHSGSTNSSGSFLFNFVVQSGQCHAGKYKVTASAGSISDSASFILGTFLQATPDQGIATDRTKTIKGTDVTIDGFVFSPNKNVVIKFDSTQVGTVSADSNGDFETHITVPEALGGFASERLSATDNGNRCNGTACSASTAFTIEPWISASTAKGPVGTQITVWGSGFGNIASPADVSKHSFDLRYCGMNADASTLVKVPFNPDRAAFDQAFQCSATSIVPLDQENRLQTSTAWTVWTTGSDASIARKALTALGSFKADFSSTNGAPESWGGYHPIYANEIVTQTSALVGTSFNGALFRVTPSITTDPASAQRGGPVTLQGNGLFQWERYTTQTGDQPPVTFAENAGLVLDFGSVQKWIDQAHFILNGQVDLAWFLDSYRPVALNAQGSIIYWDTQFNMLGSVGSQFVRVPNLDPGAYGITAYRFEMSTPHYSTDETASANFGVTSPEINTLKPPIDSIGDNVNSVMSSVGSNLQGAVGTIGSNVDAIGTNVNSVMSSVGPNLQGAVGTIGTNVNTIGTNVNSVMSSVGTNLQGTVNSINSGVGGLQNTVNSINSGLGGLQSTANTIKQDTGSLMSNVSALPQTPVTYIIAILAAIAALAAIVSTVLVSRRLKVAG